MNTYNLTFHHLGLAVASPHKAKGFLQGLGYQIGEECYDELQQVNLIMCNHQEMPDVEIIFPGQTPGPIDRILALRDAGIYHMCYTTPSLAITLADIKQAGNRLLCISPPTPAVLFGGQRVSFYMVTGFGLIEILEL